MASTYARVLSLLPHGAAHPGLAWVRMLLLVSVLLGVAGMHTLGHASTGAEHASPVSTASVVAHADPVPEAYSVPAVGADLVSGSAAHAVPGAASDPDAHAASPVTDPTTMCLAVAALVAALVGLAAAVFLPWPGPLPLPPSSLLRWVARVAPPEPPSLAKLQVLRV